MRVFLVVLMCLIMAGCRSHPRKSRETALLRAEILDLEDKYYLLKSKYEGVINQLDGGEIINSSYMDGQMIYEDGVIYEGLEIETAPAESTQPTPAPGDSSSRLRNPDGNRTIVAEPSSPPKSLRSRNQSQLELHPPQLDRSQDINVSFPRIINPNVDITAVTIEPHSTHGQDVDGVAGDEGINVFVQLETGDGKIEYQAGELTVSLIDPAEPPARQRIGLWKFVPEETKLFFAQDDQGRRGILLHLPWDQSTPAHEQLTLHVRFVTPDGRVLKTSDQLRIQPPGPDYDPNESRVVQWTRHDPRWIPEPVGHSDEPGQNHRTGQLANPVSSGGSDARRTVPASPAKSGIQRPSWRPIR